MADTTARTGAACATWSGRTHPIRPSTYTVDYAILLHTPGEPLEIVHDRHTLGVFPEATWRRLLAESGLEVVDTTVENPYALEQAAFSAKRPSA